MILYKSDSHSFTNHSYDETYSLNTDRFQHDHTFELLEELLSAHLNGKFPSSCIDIGCGQGQVLDFVWNHRDTADNNLKGSRFIGVDLSTQGIEQSENRCSEVCWVMDAYQDFLINDQIIERLKGSTDLIINKGGLTFISSEQEFIEVMKLTRDYLSADGGYFYIQNKRFYTKWSFGNYDHWQFDIFYWMNKIFGDPIIFPNEGYYAYYYPKSPNDKKAHELGPVQYINFTHNSKSLKKLQIGGDELLRSRLLSLGVDDEYIKNKIFQPPQNIADLAIERHKRILDTTRQNWLPNQVCITTGLFSTSAADGKFSTNYFINNYPNSYNINYYPYRLATTRHLVKHLYHLLEGKPNFILIPPMQDEEIDEVTAKPKIDLDETKSRFIYICSVCSAHQVIPIFLTTKGSAHPSLLTELGQQVVTIDELDRKSIITQVSTFIQGKHSQIEGKNISSNQLMPLPEKTVATNYDGTEINIKTEAGQYLYLAGGIEPYARSSNDSDEGSGTDKQIGSRFMNTTGGRNEFETFVQYMICKDLELNWKQNQKIVMVVGDSIRMRNADGSGYIIPTYEKLKNKCNLIHVPYNCGGTISWKNNINNWFNSDLSIDLVHANAGLHDLAFSLKSDSPPPLYVSPEQYAKNLIFIINSLREKGVKQIIWGLNTPVQEQWHRTIPGSDRLRRIGRKNTDIENYNAIAVDVMNDLDVIVNDLYTPMVEKGIERCVIADGVHLSHEGSELISNLVATKITEQLYCADD